MNVRVLFFGATADTAGMREVDLVLAADVSSNMAFTEVLNKFPQLLQNHDKKSLLFAINQQYATGDEIVKNGDELAVFTAVSGG